MGMLANIVFDYTLRTVVLGSAIVGIVSGILGSFAVLKKQSLLGDAISHAALPGVALAFLFTFSKDPLVLLTGAMIAGLIGTLLVLAITENSRIKKDAALGIVLSVFFGFGLFLLTIIEKLSNSKKAGLDKFLFGNASTLLQSDVVLMAVAGGIALLILFLFWKEFKLLTFDPEYCQSLGFPLTLLNVLLITLIVVSIVIGLQTVGIVLMSAMIIAPAAAARQWTDNLETMILLSAIFGAISGVTGALVSSVITKLPTGPTIVVVMSIIVFFSLLFSPHRGLLWDWIKSARDKKTIRTRSVLLNLFRLSQSHKDPMHSHSVDSITALDKSHVLRSLNELEDLGFVKNESQNKWSMTRLGLKESERLLKEVGEY